MNTLSLLLYLTDVIYSFTGWLFFGLLFGWVGYAVWRLTVHLWAEDTYSWDSSETKERKKALRLLPYLPSKKWFWISGLSILFLVVVPSKETFYLIVASEAGEAIVETPEAQDLLDDVKEIIDIQLENLKESKNNEQ